MQFNLKYIYIFFFLYSCSQDLQTFKISSKKDYESYSSKGFALIYEDSMFKKKIVNRKLNNDHNYVLHSTLDNNTVVSISNPLNSKTLAAKVKKTFNYPSIYNIVITKKMSEHLNLDVNNPYVEVLTVRKNDTFIAKEAKIFEEEKNVASKAPVTSVNINDLSDSSFTNKDLSKKPSFIIDIAEFYFLESAESAKKRFKIEGNLTNIKIKKLSERRFKMYSGPYDNFNSMKNTYLTLNELGFENLDIINVNK